MPFYEKGDVRIHYEEAGSGFPLLVIPGGGLNSTVAGLKTHPFNPFDEFEDEFRVIAADLRNAKGGQSTGPLETGRAWDAYTDDHIGLMDHLGIRQFMVMGFCIGGPFIWNLLKRAGDRVVAAVPVQPSGYRHEMPDLSYKNNMKGWGPELCERRPDITMAQVDTFLTNMYRGERADFVYTVSRDFVRQCQTPVLVLPDDVLGHPYVVAMESVYLAPNAQVTLYPWKANPKQIQIALRHVRGFLRRTARPPQRSRSLPPPSSARQQRSFPQIMQHMVNDPGMGTLVVASARADTQATELPPDWALPRFAWIWSVTGFSPEGESTRCKMEDERALFFSWVPHCGGDASRCGEPAHHSRERELRRSLPKLWPAEPGRAQPL